MHLQPVNDRIIVKIDEKPKESVTSGGIITVNTDTNIDTLATVVAVGPGKLLEDGSRADMSVKVGDRIYLTKYAGQAGLTCEGEKYHVITDAEILAVEVR